MIQLFNIPPNIPRFRDIKVGDLICVGYHGKTRYDHIHLLKVIEKLSYFAEMRIQLIKCFSDNSSCYTVNKDGILKYSTMKGQASNYRMVNGTAEVLFGERYGN